MPCVWRERKSEEEERRGGLVERGRGKEENGDRRDGKGGWIGNGKAMKIEIMHQFDHEMVEMLISTFQNGRGRDEIDGTTLHKIS